jgi:hypothetical protein
MKRPAPTFQTRESLAREIFVSFVSSPLFAEQVEELADEAGLAVLGHNSAVDAFTLADAFLKVGTEIQ